MEMMERIGGGFVMEKIGRGRGETVVLEWTRGPVRCDWIKIKINLPFN